MSADPMPRPALPGVDPTPVAEAPDGCPPDDRKAPRPLAVPLSHVLMLDERQVAAVLSTSSQFVRDLVDRGLMPMPTKLGRRSLFIREELERWVAAGCPDRARWTKIKAQR